MKKSKIAVLVLSLGLLMGGISSLPQGPYFNFEKVIKRAGEATKTNTINFGSEANDFNVKSASVSKKDDIGNTWSVVTEGTTYFSSSTSYNQLGKSAEPAKSITLTCNLGKRVKLTDFSIKFGGFSNTAGTVSIKIGDAEVGTGSLNADKDVTINATDKTKEGNVISVEVTGIAKGVKLYSLTYSYEEVVMSETEIAIDNISTNNTKAQLQYSFENTGTVFEKTYVEVTKDQVDWSGDYLIGYKVSDTEAYVFNSSLSTIDATKNYVTLPVINGKIKSSTTNDAYKFTISAVTGGYSIKSSSGLYIGKTASKNNLETSSVESSDYVNTISFNTNAIIKAGTTSLQFYNSGTASRFRYYASKQEAITLFKCVETNKNAYSFSNMKMNFGALVQKSQIDAITSSGATITEYGIAVAQKSKIDADSEVSSVTEALSASKGFVTKKAQTYNSEALTLTDATGTADTGDYVIFSANLNYPDGTTKYTEVVDAVAYFVVNGSYVVLKEKSCSVASLADEYVASDAFSSFTVYAQESLMALSVLND